MIINIPDNWLPTSENINALPEPLRDFIMRLHANTDPAGELRRAMVAEMERDALRKMMEWQPIETAPKDGTSILVSNGWKCAAVYWWPMVWMGTTHNGMRSPTHWMPLPEAPDERR